ncbi:hypothetical protein CEP54_013242 [Fusarium duplospermum]|uniref:NmrA-like domain-containing protein n=1 Tax=Fusarium duplospermum TaxID=1325734 RepID=A0A428P442_9HYPO|nr:hypothetical protein CEP54_013242 [Fusarium duplospermum]
MSQVQGRGITILGAGGNLGSSTLRALLDKDAHTITVVQRPESSSKFPPDVIVKTGNLEDEGFLCDVFKGQDAVVLMPPLSHIVSLQEPAVRAAAKASVPYLLPAEYGPDPFATKLIEENGLLQAKKKVRDLVDELGVSSWISVTVGVWLDVNLSNGLWGIDAKGRKATLYPEAGGRVSTSSITHTGEAIAAVLSLPETDLASYKKQAVYTPSFHTTHREMLDAVQRATKTTDVDWEITSRDADDALKEFNERIGQGDVFASYQKFILTHLLEGNGGDIESKVDRQELKKLEQVGLKEENIEDVIKSIL